MNLDFEIKGFKSYLKLEKSLADHTIEAYVCDISKIVTFFEMKGMETSLKQVQLQDLTAFIIWLNELGLSARSQARIISGIKAFYRYLLLEDIIDKDPTTLLETPKIGRKLPEVLSIEEIDLMINQIDLSKPGGQRDKAMLEVMYSCGLRVSELIELKLSNVYADQGFIRVVGKGSKERLIPIGRKAIKEIEMYYPDRNSLPVIQKNSEDVLFLNRRGKKLTRVMVFTLVKQCAQSAGIKRNISPHTFRHSFATHLIDGGADLRAVQEMLGHESILTTEIYTHLDRHYLRDAIIRFHPRS